MGKAESGAESAGNDMYTVPITDQEQYGTSYLDTRSDSNQRYRLVPLAEILSQPNQ